MKAKHTPGKLEWFTNGESSWIAAVDGGCTVARLGDRELDPDCPQDVDEADAARLVDCWNACIGMDDPQSAITTIKRQRDELVKALQELAGVFVPAVITHRRFSAGPHGYAEIERRVLIAKETLKSVEESK
jgi:hypothetical protein